MKRKEEEMEQEVEQDLGVPNWRFPFISPSSPQHCCLSPFTDILKLFNSYSYSPLSQALRKDFISKTLPKFLWENHLSKCLSAPSHQNQKSGKRGKSFVQMKAAGEAAKTYDEGSLRSPLSNTISLASSKDASKSHCPKFRPPCGQ